MLVQPWQNFKYVTFYERIRHNVLEWLPQLQSHAFREFILGTTIEVGVVYQYTRKESLQMSGGGSTCDQT